MELSERLKRIRKDNGYTRERLAQELGLSYGTVAKYETGEREPGHGYIKRQGDGCLHSLNPRYPDIVPADGEAIVCKGLVLGKLAAAWIVSK